MTYKFNYPDNLSPLLELQVKSIESTANKFILQISPRTPQVKTRKRIQSSLRALNPFSFEE